MARATASGQPGALVSFTPKVARHVRWARTEGIGRLIEEDRLDPASVWPPRGARPAGAAAIGSFRAPPLRSTSSTPALGHQHALRGIDLAPEVEVRNENDRQVFHQFQAPARTTFSHRRSVPAGTPLFSSSRCASRTAWTRRSTCLGCPLGAPVGVREPLARARSEVSKFQDAQPQGPAGDRGGGESIWQGQRLPPSRSSW